MVVVAQLVRALDCGSRGRRFETGLPPKKRLLCATFFYYQESFIKNKFRPIFPLIIVVNHFKILFIENLKSQISIFKLYVIMLISI